MLLFVPLLAAAAPAPKLTVSSTRPLAFGKFAPGPAAGSITVAPNGTRSTANGVVMLSSTASSAGFQVTDSGGSNRLVIISFPGAGTTLKNGSNRMTLTAFSSDRGGAAALQGGSLSLSVGATLSVAPNQQRGVYTGSVSLIVEYQ